jgi:dCTP deaminase
LDNSQLKSDAQGESNVTYDLRVGDEYRDHRDAGKIYTGERGIELFPNSAVIIQTLEHVHVPKCRFGYIVPKVSLLQQGVSNTSSKVDPGYEGPLLITVFNLGKTTVSLEYKQTFCTVVFHEVKDEGVRLYGKGAKRIIGNTRMGFLRRMLDAIERRSGLLALVVSLVVICIEAGLFHKIGEILKSLHQK